MRCAWTIAKEAKDTAKFLYNSSDDEDSYDSYWANDPYMKQKGTEYLDYMYDIQRNYNSIAKVLVYTQSIPPIEMGLRCNMLVNTKSIPCFCPFGKLISGTVNWFPPNLAHTYKHLFEQKCKKIDLTTL